MVKNWGDLYFPKGCGRTEGGVQPNKPIGSSNPSTTQPKPTKPAQTKPPTTRHHQYASSIKPARPSATVECKNCNERPRPQTGGTGGLGSPAAPGGVPVNQDLKPNYRTLFFKNFTTFSIIEQ